MRTRVAVGIGIVVAVVIALIGFKSCGGSGPGSSTSSSGNAATAATTKVAKADKRSGPVKPASLVGRVTKKSDGTGIPGAVVSITRAELLQQIMPSNEASVVVVTDAQGAWKASPVLPGTYFVAATATGFLPATRAKLIVESGDAQTGLDLVLDAGGTLVSGTINDVLGGPIGDAKVTIKRDDVFDLGGAAELVAVSKADGTYQLTLPEGDYEARATHDEYTSSRHDLEVANEPVKLDFVLTPGGVIRGQVVARDSGKPVGNAWLLAESRGRGAGGGGDGTPSRTDEHGNFVLRGLTPGAQSLKAQGPGYASASPTVVELGVGEQVDGVRVLVEGAFSISGHVVRKGKPSEGVPGIQLGVFSLGTQQYGMALEPTDADGAFVIHGVRPASYMLFAGGEGNVPELGTNVEVVDKDVKDVKVEMATGVTLTGRVEPPMANARVKLQLTGGFSITSMFEMIKAELVHGETDATGAFTVKNAPSGAFTLVASAKTGETGKLPVMIGETDQAGLVIKLETRASISGRVVDDKGTVVADATVSARKAGGDDDSFSMSMGNDRKSGNSRRDGTFKIVGLEEGTYQLSVRDNDRGGSVKLKDPKAAKFELTKAQQLTNVVITVEARDGVIRGVVVGADRRPVADAWVTAERARPDWKKLAEEKKKPDEKQMEEMMDWDWGTKPVLTGADGRFVIDRLRRGTYKLVAQGPRGQSHGEVAEVKTGSSVTITLLSLGTLSGKVTANGAPVAAYDISCDGPGDEEENKTVTAADGTYTLERLAPGKYECVVDADAGTGKEKVDVPPGPAKLDFALAKWGVITGKIVDVLTKQPVQNVLIMSSSTANGAKMFEDMLRDKGPKPDASGVFTLPRVAAGEGTISITQKDMMMMGKPLATKPYKIASGERVDLGTIEVVKPREGDAGTFGFATVVNEGKLVVSSVKADGPAAGAGVKEQDQVVAINGMPVSTLTPEVAQLLTSSGVVGVGIPVKLSLDRGGSPVDVSLVSVKW